jgi:hypothetical protein
MVYLRASRSTSGQDALVFAQDDRSTVRAAGSGSGEAHGHGADTDRHTPFCENR